MRGVSETLGVTTSTVSQQIAALAREVGTPLIEPEGRRVRLTPAGHRLADHAVTILGAMEAARVDLDPSAEPEGTVRVAAFASAIRQVMVPVLCDCAGDPSRHTAAVARARAGRSARPAGGGRRRPGVDLRLQPRAGAARQRPRDPTARDDRVGTRRAVAVGTCTEYGVGRVRPVPRRRLDRELAQHRRRGGGARHRVAGRLPSEHHAPRRQPRAGAGHDPGRHGRRAAPGQPADRARRDACIGCVSRTCSCARSR